MKIGPVSGVDSISNRMSITRVNDDEKKNVPLRTQGYKSKQLKLIIKFRKFVRDYDVTEDKNGKGGGDTPEDDLYSANDEPEIFDTVTNILFSDDISDGIRNRVKELLAGLSKYQGEGEAVTRTIHLNKNNIGLFIEILKELMDNNLYFGSDTVDDKTPGSVIDFKA